MSEVEESIGPCSKSISEGSQDAGLKTKYKLKYIVLATCYLDDRKRGWLQRRREIIIRGTTLPSLLLGTTYSEPRHESPDAIVP